MGDCGCEAGLDSESARQISVTNKRNGLAKQRRSIQVLACLPGVEQLARIED
ncbi:hypothetical protein ACSS6W_003450 [Trichoderma asperelloides]